MIKEEPLEEYLESSEEEDAQRKKSKYGIEKSLNEGGETETENLAILI